MAHRAAAGTSPKRTTGGPQTGGRPHPAAGPLGGPPPGEVGLGAGGGTDAGKAANPTPRRPQPATGPPPPRQSAPAGGLRPPAPRRPATRPDAGRPRAGAGQGRAAAMGRGRPGRASTGPACTRPAAYLFRPRPPPLGAGGDNRHGGGPGRRALCARDSGRAEGPRGGRIRTRSDGAGRCRSGTGWGGTVRIEAGAVPPGRGAASAAKKMAGGLSPRLDTTGRKKMRGGRFVPPACRYSGYQISPCSA